MNYKKSMMKILSILLLFLLFLSNFSFLLTNNMALFGAEEPLNTSSTDPSDTSTDPSDTSTDTQDVSTVEVDTEEKRKSDIDNALKEIMSIYEITDKDAFPVELWKDSEEEFNNVILSTLNVASLEEITVANIVNDITTLNLSNAGITVLPNAFFCMASLESVNLSGNNLVVIDFSDSFLVSLKDIDISKNSAFQGISVHDLPRLKNLNLNRCNIRSLSTVSINKNLANLDLSENKIEAISVSNISSLGELNISNSGLRFLEIINCENLSSLLAADNELAAVNFENLPKLSNIDLSNNFLTSIPDLSFVENIVSLNLKMNQILAIPQYITEKTLSGQGVDFSDNLIDGEENQRKLILSDDIQLSITQTYTSENLELKIRPYIGVASAGDLKTAQPISENFKLIVSVGDDGDAPSSISTDFVSDINLALSKKSSPDIPLTNENIGVLVLSASFKAAGDIPGANISGTPIIKEVVAPKPDEISAVTSSSELSLESSKKESTASSSVSGKSSTSTSLPSTGAEDFPTAVVGVFLIAIILAVIISLLKIGLRKS